MTSSSAAVDGNAVFEGVGNVFGIFGQIALIRVRFLTGEFVTIHADTLVDNVRFAVGRTELKRGEMVKVRAESKGVSGDWMAVFVFTCRDAVQEAHETKKGNSPAFTSTDNGGFRLCRDFFTKPTPPLSSNSLQNPAVDNFDSNSFSMPSLDRSDIVDTPASPRRVSHKLDETKTRFDFCGEPRTAEGVGVVYATRPTFGYIRSLQHPRVFFPASNMVAPEAALRFARYGPPSVSPPHYPSAANSIASYRRSGAKVPFTSIFKPGTVVRYHATYCARPCPGSPSRRYTCKLEPNQTEFGWLADQVSLANRDDYQGFFSGNGAITMWTQWWGYVSTSLCPTSRIFFSRSCLGELLPWNRGSGSQIDILGQKVAFVAVKLDESEAIDVSATYTALYVSLLDSPVPAVGYGYGGRQSRDRMRYNSGEREFPVRRSRSQSISSHKYRPGYRSSSMQHYFHNQRLRHTQSCASLYYPDYPNDSNIDDDDDDERYFQNNLDSNDLYNDELEQTEQREQWDYGDSESEFHQKNQVCFNRRYGEYKGQIGRSESAFAPKWIPLERRRSVKFLRFGDESAYYPDEIQPYSTNRRSPPLVPDSVSSGNSAASLPLRGCLKRAKSTSDLDMVHFGFDTPMNGTSNRVECGGNRSIPTGNLLNF